MAKTKNRIGETNVANNGMLITIIAYRGSNDIDVEFEDGLIRKHTAYKEFKLGHISHKETPKKDTATSRIGETIYNNKNEKMTIIAYRHARDIDIQFENGAIAKHKAYGNFQKGEIQNPKFRIGNSQRMSNGQIAKIIEYKNTHNFKIQFEDGTIVPASNYSMFVKGQIKNPNFVPKEYIERIGKTSINNQGVEMKIIAYRKADDIDIQFEDGTIITTSYEAFKEKWCKNPNLHLNEKGIANCGIPYTIVNYREYEDLDIQFEDGYLVKNRRYSHFTSGRISHPFPFILDENIFVKKIAYKHKSGVNFEYICQNCEHHDIGTWIEMKNHQCDNEKEINDEP